MYADVYTQRFIFHFTSSYYLLGPKLDWDPDIVAALDEDFDFDDPENQLEDDFVIKANELGSSEEDDQQRCLVLSNVFSSFNMQTCLHIHDRPFNLMRHTAWLQRCFFNIYLYTCALKLSDFILLSKGFILLYNTQNCKVYLVYRH